MGAVILARPLNAWRWVLVALMGGSLVVALALASVRHYFELVVPDRAMVLIAVGIAAVAGAVIEVAWRCGWLGPRPTDPTAPATVAPSMPVGPDPRHCASGMRG